MKFTNIVSAALAVLFADSASAHMFLSQPPALNGKGNPNSGSDFDSSQTSPISGANFPCKGTLGLLGTPKGASVATWQAGSSQKAVISGGAFHGGGSCQFSLSYDKGKTFKVLHSYIGSCPLDNGDSSFDFKVPADAPNGEALFAWTWFNQIGNREMYMNCAVITVAGGGGAAPAGGVAFNSRPDIFVANIGNGCGTKESTDVEFPNPGPDVTKKTVKGTSPPTGQCAAAAPPAVGGGGSGAGAPASSAPASTPASAPASAPASSAPAAPPATSAAAAPTTSSAAAAPPSSAAPTSATFTKETGLSVIPIDTRTLGASQTTTSQAKPTATSSSTKDADRVSSSTSVSGPPGGIFVTTPVPAPSATSAPTTLVTSTSRAAGNGTLPAVGATSSAATAPTATPVTGGGGGATAPVAGQLSGACTNEGAWNCVAGTSFQRCASGSWSAMIPMAPGLACKPGVADVLMESRVARRRLRYTR